MRNVVVLTGGVGGTRLVDGLASSCDDEQLTVIVNTGDDFDHLGLRVCPDLDTVMYTLAGFAPEERGWGIAGDTFVTLGALARLGAPDWFQVGDRDLATHVWRTHRLASGTTLTDATREMTRRLGVTLPILPMSDAPAPTVIETTEGQRIPFQNWLVEQRAVPDVRRVHSERTGPASPLVLDALADADLVVIGPSNPFVSIEPILALPNVRALVAEKPCVAVSPIVAGRAVKGPLVAMMRTLRGVDASAAEVARLYADLVDIWFVHHGDGATLSGSIETDILIERRRERARLAAEVLHTGRRLAAG